MITRIITSALRKTIRPEDAPEADDVVEPDLAFPPMVPVVPPAAQNDDPDQPLLGEIERDLRAAGYLS
ncbi:hypothetical protein M446_6201 [Methylobacterium sp. 4-46]|uniref:hypothetical protein n=1 Tax=unclassified Methylobacterium TaxID=2615210 RepID=UPI000165CE10|nr:MULTISPECIES: hypothetical protein [Methylobacterium]ACA20469.1 hypothetical protein M446_6201 [Methylobacterium sp. 4-46]WFT79637.1 hypothetical protein QA634_31325 [Methylobacterium nodulans]